MRFKSFVLLSILWIFNCYYSIDNYNRKYNLKNLELGVIFSKATINCEDSNSKIFRFRSNSLERFVKIKFNEINQNNKINANIKDVIDIDITWKHCDFVGGKFEEEERKEANLNAIFVAISIGTLTIFPVPIKTRDYLDIQISIRNNICKSKQPIRYGFIAHLLHIPLIGFIFTDTVNHDILDPALSRGIDEIIEKYNNNECDKI